MSTTTLMPPAQVPPNSRILDLWWKARGNGTAVNTELVQIGGAGAGATMNTGAGALCQVIGGRPCVELTPNAADPQLSLQTAGVLFTGPVLRQGMVKADNELAPIYRLRARFRRRIIGGNPGPGFGMQWRLSAAGISANIGTATGAGFALVMDGAGGWQLLARQQIAGPLVLTQPIIWPNGDTVPTTWEMRVLPPTPTDDATFQLLADGQVVFSQAWGVAPFGDYSGAGAPFQWMPAFAAGPVGPSDTLLVESLRCIYEAELSE
jgi:hypothetical protein